VHIAKPQTAPVQMRRSTSALLTKLRALVFGAWRIRDAMGPLPLAMYSFSKAIVFQPADCLSRKAMTRVGFPR